MIERELREKIIVTFLNYRDKSNTDINQFCSDNNIDFTSREQKQRIFQALKDAGYINSTFYEGGGGFFTITSKGIDAAEELIADSLIETDRLVKEGNFEIDIKGSSAQSEDQVKVIQTESCKTKENFQKYQDQSIEACFGVNELAQCFLKQLDSIAYNDTNNVCMVGIFAPWGRGKSYFFGNLKQKVTERTDDKALKYNVVEFNAWKHQETPAIWAYLFETLYKSNSCCFRFWYTLSCRWKSLLSDILIALIPVVAVFILKLDCAWKEATIFTISIGLIINFLIKRYNSAISLIRKYSKGISFSNELGIQAEIEKELTSLLRFKISDKKASTNKILLYVDDIDRCSELKMMSIIDSLRTILENDVIRKRLVIICSIDPEKVIKGIEYKYKDLYKDEELERIAIEQMDKIFLTGIALPNLDEAQLHEFLSKLTGIETTEQIVKEQKGVPYSINRKKSSLFVGNPISEDKEYNNVLIHRWILDFIRSTNVELTPRKVRVIYYRILLANNILHSGAKETLITNNIVNEICALSCGKYGRMRSLDALADVVEMVVPYKYNNENK